MNGILLINKDTSCTSRDVVNELTKIFHTKKIGHTGTLDPIATGVLVICIGSATKLVEIISAEEKEYEALVVLGRKTDTLDITGNTIYEEDFITDEDKIKISLVKMTKTYMQEVPIYSAVKVNGKKLYEYARSNIKVNLPKKEVIIKSLELIDKPFYQDNKTYFKIRTTVSKGTYIRSLINDIADCLGTYGTMVELKRIRQGEYKIEDCYNLDNVKSGNYNLIDVNSIINKFETIKVDDYLENKIKNGCILENRYNSDVIAFIDKNDNLLAIYKSYDKDCLKIKPWKMFNN